MGDSYLLKNRNNRIFRKCFNSPIRIKILIRIIHLCQYFLKIAAQIWGKYYKALGKNQKYFGHNFISDNTVFVCTSTTVKIVYSTWNRGQIYDASLERNSNDLTTRRSSHQRCSTRKGVPKNFAKFTGKYLSQSLFFNKVAGQVWGLQL